MLNRKSKLLAATAILLVSGANQAWAANECGPAPVVVNPIVNCVAASSPFSSVEYEPGAGVSTFTLTAGGGTPGTAVSISAANIAGVGQIGVAVGDLLPVVNLLAGATPDTVIVNITNASTVSGNAAGVVVLTDGSGNDARINNAGTVTSNGAGTPYILAALVVGGLDGDGLIASAGAAGGPAGSGNATVWNQSTGVVNAFRDGVVVRSSNGIATGTNDGTIIAETRDGMTTAVTLLGVAVPTGGSAILTNNKTINAGRDGMNASAVGNATASNNGTNGTVIAGRDGIVASSLTGNAAVSNIGPGAKVDAGRNGMSALSFGTSTASNTGDGAEVKAGGTGIFVLGQTAIANNSGKVESTGGDGIQVLSSQAATVNGTNGTVIADDDGITATRIAFGPPAAHNVTIDSGTTDAKGNGVFALNGGLGDATVTTHKKTRSDGFIGAGAIATDGNAKVTIKDDISGLSAGVLPQIGGGAFAVDGNATVLVDPNKVVNAQALGLGALAIGGNAIIDSRQATVNSKGLGILGIAVDGNATVDSGRVDIDHVGSPLTGSAVVGVAIGGDATVTTHDKISVNNGLYGAAAFAVGGNATVNVNAEIDPPLIGASALTFGPGNAVVNVAAGVPVDATQFGAAVGNIGSGNATLNNNGAITSGFTGVAGLKIGGTGALTLNNNTGASIEGDTVGVAIVSFAILGDSNVATLNNDGRVQGNDLAAPVIFALQDGGLDIFNTANGLIQGDQGAISDDLGRTEAIVLSIGGRTNIDNTGKMIGNIALLSTDNNTVTNRAAGRWFTGGLNIMGLTDNDLLENFGLIDASDDTTFEFTGGNDTVRNKSTGIIRVNGVARFLNVTNFDNDGLLTMIDGAADDRTRIDAAYDGGASDGALDIDAFLGIGGAADRLNINGSATGTTLVSVNDLNAGVAAGFDPFGIRVVDVDGGVDGQQNFVLANGPIDKGFFDYDLYFVPQENGVPNQDDRWYLRNDVNERAFELAKLASAAKEIWHESANRWLDRTSDLRAFMGAAKEALIAPGAWVRGYGAFYDRDTLNALNTAAGPVIADTSYGQDIYGVQGGIDFMLSDVLAPAGKLLLGVMGGYTWSKVDFDTTGSKADIDGFNVGAYATYLEGGLFADLLVKADFHEVDYSTTFLAPDNSASFDGVSIGAVLDMGYRFGEEDGLGPFFIEPGMTWAYTNNDMDEFEMLSTSVDINNNDSLRGRLGVRMGHGFNAWSQTRVETFVDGSVWHEFVDNTGVTLSSAASTTRVKDVTEGTWGEVGLGLNITDLENGMTGFVKAEYRFGEEQDGASVQAGVRLKF